VSLFAHIHLSSPFHTFILHTAGDKLRDDTDHEELFRQESNFLYLFGVNEPNLYGVLDLVKRESILFVPRLTEEYELWCGKRPTHDMYKQKYGVDHVHYVDELTEVLKSRDIQVVHTNYGKNADSGNYSREADFPGMSDNFKVDNTVLHPHLVECRVIKSDAELDVMRYVTRIASEAHIQTMRACKPGMYEYMLESTFRHHCQMKGGCRYMAYTCICGSGANGAVLHYGHAAAPNDKKIENDDMLLLDMGMEYHGYCSDITCSYPADGKFSDKHRQVYEAVLAASRAVIGAMKPGVKWVDMHRLAERAILEHLVKNNFVLPLGKTLDELHALHIPAMFMPHGLGHLIGLDTHDVGGYPAGVERPAEPGVCNLRTARVLEENMCITVEPGMYFIEAQLNKGFNNPDIAPHLNKDKLKEFLDFGGVRIEDDMIVTKDGCESMSNVPRDIDDIEKLMSEQA
jgi:Xaa-Pro dipeptidase